jgi:RND family efflux transporter MFP subunit
MLRVPLASGACNVDNTRIGTAMPADNTAERNILLLGLLPLMASAVWLVLLREPPPVRAHAAFSQRTAVREREFTPSQSRFLGVIVAGQDAQLGAQLAGQVVRVFAQAGARVQRGDALLQLSSPLLLGSESLARAQLEQDRSAERVAELAVETARDKYERMQSAPSAYSRQDLDAARLDVRRAQAELDKLRAGSAVQRTTRERDRAQARSQTLRAPFDGVLADRYVDRGDFVAAGAALARVLDDARFVRFAVPAAELARLHTGSTLQVAARDSLARWSATLTQWQPELEAATGYVFARAVLAGASDPKVLIPGTRVDVLDSVEDAHSVPAARPAPDQPR